MSLEEKIQDTERVVSFITNDHQVHNELRYEGIEHFLELKQRPQIDVSTSLLDVHHAEQVSHAQEQEYFLHLLHGLFFEAHGNIDNHQEDYEKINEGDSTCEHIL